MKKRAGIVVLGLIALILVAAVIIPGRFSPRGADSAQKRLVEFADAVNYNKPDIVYSYLTSELRAKITKEQFIKNFAHERSYPYLTPFYINFLEVKIEGDNNSGVGVFSVAARLPGEIYEQPFIYENGNYYMQAFENIVDGSYVKLFDRLD